MANMNPNASNLNRVGAGRPKGAKNKKTLAQSEIKDKILEIISGKIENLENDLDSLKPSERAKLTIELLSYCLPKLKSVQMKAETTERFIFTPLNIDVEQ